MDPRIKHAVAFIGEHLQSRITVEDLATNAALSVSQFTRLFRRDLGSTPSAFVNRLRIERAALLLERTNLSVGEVMAQVGITDPSHFARDFRRAHGFSPRTYRQHLRGSSQSIYRPVPNPITPPPPVISQTHETGLMTAPPDRRSGGKDRRRFTRTDRRVRPEG